MSSLDPSAENKYLIAGRFQQSNDLPETLLIEPNRWGGLVLTVTSGSENSISGTWGTGEYGDGLAHGTFTFTMQ
ncbi:MAG: hypothetical protein NTY48_01575 [Candidatus Diapherotrites archaeon]|nr:hypothetical protein [Candidatus Diapherotrites archaeon]